MNADRLGLTDCYAFRLNLANCGLLKHHFLSPQMGHSLAQMHRLPSRSVALIPPVSHSSADLQTRPRISAVCD